MTFNFDDVMRLRTEAAAQGIGKKLWFDFAQIMFDEFPSLYETARQMTIHQDDIWKERNELLAALKSLLDASEKHIFGNECKQQRDAARSAIAKVEAEE